MYSKMKGIHSKKKMYITKNLQRKAWSKKGGDPLDIPPPPPPPSAPAVVNDEVRGEGPECVYWSAENTLY